MLLTQHRADRVVIYNISWQQFENILADLGEHRAVRIAYYEKTLEIMTPLPEQEYYKEILGELPTLIERYRNQGRLTLRCAMREWVKEHSLKLS